MTNETTCIIKPPIPPIIQIHGTDGRALLTIHPNGTVEGDIEDASEAARVFVEHIRRLVALPTQSDALRITDEMVERAAIAFYNDPPMSGRCINDAMKAALIAALQEQSKWLTQ